ncbi:hypothetical protein BD289DRAFT_131242 [Coniella lustricola]|uniref:Uncharacterized protein n=1 Tax=Coniella lustricola TaxID=2025994 RepID=A0A2T3AFN1_9PEZI|nr:hypothetical protein BD289DRAFT_131242 [Coniella lustricola]
MQREYVQHPSKVQSIENRLSLPSQASQSQGQGVFSRPPLTKHSPLPLPSKARSERRPAGPYKQAMTPISRFTDTILSCISEV